MPCQMEEAQELFLGLSQQRIVGRMQDTGEKLRVALLRRRTVELEEETAKARGQFPAPRLHSSVLFLTEDEVTLHTLLAYATRQASLNASIRSKMPNFRRGNAEKTTSANGERCPHMKPAGF
jgi:hypothetical protein